MSAADDRLFEAIPPGRSLLIDTSVVLAYLSGTEPSSELARQVFDACAATGRNATTLSTVTVAEMLVRPFRRGEPAVATTEGFLRHFAEMRIIDVSYPIARQAAGLRALTDLPMPDALIIATAAVERIDIVITNDHAWTRAGPALEDLDVVILVDLITSPIRRTRFPHAARSRP
ncbi:MAG: PIN domain-containing protein [Chloroflexota bacterium]